MALSTEPSVGELKDLYVEFSKPAKIFQPDDYLQAQKLATALRTYLAEKAERVVASAGHMPILYSYQSDATSFLTRTTHRSRAGSAKIQRVGSQLSDMLLERGFVMTMSPSGVVKSAVIVKEP